MYTDRSDIREDEQIAKDNRADLAGNRFKWNSRPDNLIHVGDDKAIPFKLNERMDERLYQEVMQALRANSLIDMSQVQIQVKDAEVTLTGTVNSRSLKSEITDALSRLENVKKIFNYMEIQNSGISAAPIV